MSTVTHEIRLAVSSQWRARLRRFVRDGFAAITAATVLAVILVATGLMRLLALPASHAAIAEALHKVGEAMGPPF